MRYSSFVFITLLTGISWLFFSFFFSYHDYREISKAKNYLKRSTKKYKSIEPIISDSLENNFWFIQITDLHISRYNDHGRSKDLLRFCNENVKIIKPALVIVSGDLTDAKSPSALNSKQHKEEWKTYRSIIKKSNVLNFTKWLDIRGNHDSFNVPNIHHADNLFRYYSVQGTFSHQAYKYVHSTPFGNYNFIGIDACPDPGFKRPYNFFGVVQSQTAEILQIFSRESSNSNFTIWFGHYPTSTMISPYLDLRSLIGESGYAYMCGHLHTLLNKVPKMYALQSEGFMELELADWRDSRYYRIGVIDHDIFSFQDTSIDDWPVVIISNPKNSNFVLPSKEAAFRIYYSTHIRIFVWPPNQEFIVKVLINNQSIGSAKRVQSNHPLFVLPWSPQKLSNDAHVISVHIQNQSGYVLKSVTQTFRNDGSPDWNFQKWPSIILMGNMDLYVKTFYYIVWSALLLFIVSIRILALKKSQLFPYQDNLWVVACVRFGANDQLFYPILIYLLYSASCPLLLTELVDEHWGFVFVHGIYIDGNYIPEASPYISELSQNGTIIIPLIFILIRNIRFDDIYIDNMYHFFSRQWFFMLLMSWQFCLIIYWTLVPYGVLTTLFSPCRLHVITLAIYLMHSVRKTKKLSRRFFVSLDNQIHPRNITDHVNNTSGDDDDDDEEENELSYESSNSVEIESGGINRKHTKFLHPDRSFANLESITKDV